MPKMKTHRGAAKRFSKTGTGKLKRQHAHMRHLLEGKASGRKRQLGKAALVSKGDAKRIEQMLVYVK